ncbi:MULTISPECIES: hypothetical protein [Nostocales]|uniref:Uncharacterized protein n=3 Tax=Nostocales TaxID=1161 RepID=A0A8S9T6F0_9CYAN|nr:hypothetical protein [Tolypothrix bouteillei]KAF3887975.1 hypothetical protein DA73_0400022630 [Tolypothrix bouteillei VB521301]
MTNDRLLTRSVMRAIVEHYYQCDRCGAIGHNNAGAAEANLLAPFNYLAFLTCNFGET